MPKRSSKLLLEDILTAIMKIERYVTGLDQTAFLNDEKTVDAVIRNLEIIGEASRQLPDDFKANHDDIPWHEIAGLRNRIVHDYMGVDLEIVWYIIDQELDPLKARIQKLL